MDTVAGYQQSENGEPVEDFSETLQSGLFRAVRPPRDPWMSGSSGPRRPVAGLFTGHTRLDI